MKAETDGEKLHEKGLNGQCEACGHVWTIAYLPQPMSSVVKLGRAARCPKGCTAQISIVLAKKETTDG